MDDDVVAALHAVNERIKKVDDRLKAEVDEREGLDGRFQTTDGQVDSIVKALGAWRQGNIGKKIEETDKRLDAIEKRLPKK